MDKVRRGGVEGSSLVCVSLPRRLPLRSSPTTNQCVPSRAASDRPCNTENFVISSLSLIARPRGSSSDCGVDEAHVSARASTNATPRNLRRRRGLELDLPLADAASTLLKNFSKQAEFG